MLLARLYCTKCIENELSAVVHISIQAFCQWYKDIACKDMVNRKPVVQPRFHPSPILLHALNFFPSLSFLAHIGQICCCSSHCTYSSTLAPVGENQYFLSKAQVHPHFDDFRYIKTNTGSTTLTAHIKISNTASAGWWAEDEDFCPWSLGDDISLKWFSILYF